MGRILFEPHREAGTYIADHFSHRDLVRELRIEAPYARQGLIVPDVFWTKVEASYLSDPRMFLGQHQCSILDYIVRHDDLPAAPDPAVTTAISPPTALCPTPDISSPPTSTGTPVWTGTHDPGDPPQVIGVPEPSSFVLAGFAALLILACVLARALRRRPQSAAV
jgi:hypothetical protein